MQAFSAWRCCIDCSHARAHDYTASMLVEQTDAHLIHPPPPLPVYKGLPAHPELLMAFAPGFVTMHSVHAHGTVRPAPESQRDMRWLQ